MRTQWIACILSILLSMGLLVVIMGQYKVITMLNDGDEHMQMQSDRLSQQYINEDLFKVTVEKLLVQGNKALEELTATVTKLGSEMEKKKKENDACQAEKKTKADELAGAEKQHKDTEASLKAESDAWTQEINNLKAQLTGYRPICDHVKNSSLAIKLCGPKTT